MLVLSRKLNQKIVISGGITVTVLEIRRGKVRLGFKGPPDIQFTRDDCVNTKPRERKSCER